MSAAIVGGVGVAAGLTLASLIWRKPRGDLGRTDPAPLPDGPSTKPALASEQRPTSGMPAVPQLPQSRPSPVPPSPSPTQERGTSGQATGEGFAPGYRGPSKAQVEQIRDPTERNYTRGYATAVFAVRGGFVIDVPYGDAEKYYVDAYTRGYEDGDAAKKPRFTNAATQISHSVAVAKGTPNFQVG